MPRNVTAASPIPVDLGTPACLLNLRTVLPSLPENHARIAHFVMLNPAEFLDVDARKIGYLCGTSEATVVRFCQRIGYRGLSEMKKVLARELATNLVSFRHPGKFARESSVLDHVFADCAQAVGDTLSGINRSRFNSIANAIARCEHLYLLGAGGSAHVTQLAALNFLSVGFKTFAFVDPIQQLAAAKLATPRDVAIAVTYSGNQSDVAEALQSANKRDALCIGITSFQHSLISKSSHELLLMFIPAETLRGQTGAHRVAQIALLDALAVRAAEVKGSSHRARKR
jgi:RpiR family transcriptional regulator, carbohydrate utilization regulator